METDAPQRTLIPASAATSAGPEIQLPRLARWACGLTFEDLPADVVGPTPHHRAHGILLMLGLTVTRDLARLQEIFDVY